MFGLRKVCVFTALDVYRWGQGVASVIKSACIRRHGIKHWNMERAIRVLAGRHRDQEKFAPFMHMRGATFPMSGSKPVYQDGKWDFENQNDLYLDREGVEAFRNHFYALEGWDVDTGWPTRKTLEGLGMRGIADTLANRVKLGS